MTQSIKQKKIIEAIDSIEKIYWEIRELFLHDYIFWQVQHIIAGNVMISSKTNHFFEWMKNIYAQSASMQVRRFVDNRKGTVSFLRLLGDLSRPPVIITREYFIDKYCTNMGYPVNEQTMVKPNSLFDEYVGENIHTLSKIQIQTDSKLLRDKAKLLKDYSDSYVAHHGERPNNSIMPTFHDLKECLSFLEILLHKYYLLIKGQFIDKFEIDSMFRYNWKEIFYYPWMSVDNNVA